MTTTNPLESTTNEELAELWRDYWREQWHCVDSWPLFEDRREAFLTASAGRKGESPIVQDAPTGRAPFLGILTVDEQSGASVNSGVVTFPHRGHLLTIAPTRTGKGTCHIVPNLLLYAGSSVVIDIKGENYDLTGTQRAKMFEGARVIRFAPFSDELSARYNPLDFVRVNDDGSPAATTFDDSRLLAEMLIPHRPHRDEFWQAEARTLLHAVIMHVACRYRPGDPERNIACVLKQLFRPSEKDEAGNLNKGYALVIAELSRTARAYDYTPLQALASTLYEHDEKVRAGVFSTCRSEMKIWLSESLQRATARSDFQFSDLKSSMCRPVNENPAPVTLYIVIPPEYLAVYSTLLRTIIGLAIIELTRPPAWDGREGWRDRPPCPVLFILDELAALGEMKPVVEGLAYLAGYDVQLWSFVQNIGQMKDIYGTAWENFPANSGATSFFGVNDPDTAEYLERLLGETPERLVYYDHRTSGTTIDYSREPGKMTNSTSGTAVGHRFVRNKVMSAAEVRALSEDLELIFIRNTEPILASKLPFYKFELIKDLAGQWLLGASA